MDRIRRMLGGRSASFDAAWSLEGVDRGWSDRPSIAAWVAARLDADGRYLGDDLPDEHPAVAGKVRWAPGAVDGVTGHHVGRGEANLGPVVAALRSLATRPDARSFARLGEAVSEGSMLQLADPLSRALPDTGIPSDRLAGIGRVLVAEAPGRDLVKLGILLIGLTGARAIDGPAVTSLGAHEEFTVFAVVALLRLGCGERDLWALARRTRSWGRIHVVERLRGTTDPEIRAWMLRDGFRNAVVDGYLACTCAVTGGLLDALRAPTVDDALFTGARDILAALAEGGPAESLEDYADADAVVMEWLRHLGGRTVAPADVALVDALADAEEVAPDVRALLTIVRDAPATSEVVARGLEDPDRVAFAHAVVAARRRGIDPIEATIARLHSGGDDPDDLAYLLVLDIDESQIDRALDALRPLIDPVVVGTGPTREIGLGPGFDTHAVLDQALGAIRRFPGHGGDLVLLAIGSPTVRNRHLALGCLEAWGEASWPTGTRARLEAAIAVEPDLKVEARMRTLLG